MKKIFEIDSAIEYSRHNIVPWKTRSFKTLKRDRRRWRVKDEWLTATLLPSQLQFHEKHKLVFRPSPSHNPTVEVFVDETDLSDTDWTIIGLIFSK